MMNGTNNDNGGPSTVVGGDNNPCNEGIIGNGSFNIVNRNGTVNIQPNCEPDELERWGCSQYISRDALHNSRKSPPKCHRGTRTTILEQVEEWIDNTQASPMLWLYGPAGVGKSVISKTLADDLAHKVVATFFFSTSSNKTGETLFPTLAWQLARKYPVAKHHFLESLKTDSHLLESEMEKPFLFLIELLEQVRTATSVQNLVIIIDGVDECTDNDMKYNFLRLLECFAMQSGKWLRFLISSRPEPTIRSVLEKTPQSSHRAASTAAITTPAPDHSVYANARPKKPLDTRLREWIAQYVPDIKSYVASVKGWKPPHLFELSKDIRKLYQPLQYREIKTYEPPRPEEDFDKIKHHSIVSRIQIGSSFGSTKDIERYLDDMLREKGGVWKSSFKQDNLHRLAEICCGQFLYASIIERVIIRDELTVDQLLDLSSGNVTESFSSINDLYSAILNQQKRGHLRDILGILVVFSENLHFINIERNFPIIEGILNLPNDVLITKLSKMHSLLKVEEESVSVYHRSFLEFLQDKDRSKSHHVAYPKALWTFLGLLRYRLLRYGFQGFWGQLSEDGSTKLECLHNTHLIFSRNFFRQSSNPNSLKFLHMLAHTALTLLVWVPICWYTRPFLAPFTISLCSLPTHVLLMQYLLVIIAFFVVSFGSFMLSFACYHFGWSRGVIHPFFHPFLNSDFSESANFFFALGLRDILLVLRFKLRLFVFATVLLVIVKTNA